MEFGIKADIWSITSFNELARGGIISDQKNMNEKKSNHMLRAVLKMKCLLLQSLNIRNYMLSK